jgi:hypothetical protein
VCQSRNAVLREEVSGGAIEPMLAALLRERLSAEQVARLKRSWMGRM